MRWFHRLLRWVDTETFAGIGHTSARERLFDWDTLTMTLRRGHWRCSCGEPARKSTRVSLLLDAQRERMFAHLLLETHE